MKKTFLCAALFLAFCGGLNAQCFLPLACPTAPITICDTTANNHQFWNDSLFFDPVISSHDLGDAPTQLAMQIVDTCSTGNVGSVTAYFVLRFDLDGDGIFETAVSSKALPGTDIVNFGNANNPNFTGGIARHFDTRPVPTEQKYGFALEQTVQGNVTTARVRWATAAAPNDYVDPQLPFGLYRIDWYFEHLDSMNWDYQHCNYVCTIKDCQAPTVACQNNKTVNLPPTQLVQVKAIDFTPSAEDNYTPTPQLQYGLRQAGTGTGFPLDGNGNPVTKRVFGCADLGVHPIEVWARDQAGNASFCTVQLTVQDSVNNCGPHSFNLCAIHQCDGQPVPEVLFEVSGSSNAVPPFTLVMLLDSTGCGTSFSNALPIASNVSVVPNKDDHPLEGVNTLDLVLITRQVLGVELLDSPYKLIAAAASKSGAVLSYDVAELRKLILGIYQELPNNTSWRFVDTSFVFPNPANPFQTVFPESTPAAPFLSNVHKSFYGMKIGDVNCTALQPLEQPPVVDAITIPNLDLQANDIVEVPVTFLQGHDYYGFQFGLHYDPALVQVLSMTPGVGTPDNFNVFASQVKVSWSAPALTTFLPDEPLFYLHIQALAPLHLADAFTLDTVDIRPQAYSNLVSDSLVGLQFVVGMVATTEPGAVRQIFTPQPNPTTAGVRIPVRLDQSANITVEILDGQGRLLYRQEQSGNAGAQWLEVPASAFPQAGLYFWRIQAGELFGAGTILRQ